MSCKLVALKLWGGPSFGGKGPLQGTIDDLGELWSKTQLNEQNFCKEITMYLYLTKVNNYVAWGINFFHCWKGVTPEPEGITV